MSEIDNEILQHLLGATARGDTKAFNGLYDETSPRLFAVAVTMMRERALAEDVLQDAFVQVWHRAGDYHVDRGSVLTWMTTIVRYRAIDLLRKRERDGSSGSGGQIDVEPEDLDRLLSQNALADDGVANRGPLARAVSSEEQSMLRKCIDKLSNNQQQSVALAFFRGLTHQELSTCLAQPLGTIKSRLRRSLMRLKDCLESLGDGIELHRDTY